MGLQELGLAERKHMAQAPETLLMFMASAEGGLFLITSQCGTMSVDEDQSCLLSLVSKIGPFLSALDRRPNGFVVFGIIADTPAFGAVMHWGAEGIYCALLFALFANRRHQGQ